MYKNNVQIFIQLFCEQLDEYLYIIFVHYIIYPLNNTLYYLRGKFQSSNAVKDFFVEIKCITFSNFEK